MTPARSRADTVPVATCHPSKFDMYRPATRPAIRATAAGPVLSPFDPVILITS
jgi:hypothetical protein